MDDEPITAGQSFERAHPFTRFVVVSDGEEVFSQWRSGAWIQRACGPDDVELICHKEGKAVFTVLAVVPLPGRLHTRILYTRTLIYPDDQQTTSAVTMTVAHVFKRRVERFACEYTVDSDEDGLEEGHLCVESYL